jgi:nitroreductase
MIKDSALTIVILADADGSDVWIEDASIATAYLHLASHDLGLGSCWVQIRNRMQDYDQKIMSETLVQEILGIPEHKKVLAMLAVGYPAETKEAYQTKDLDFSKIHIEKY